MRLKPTTYSLYAQSIKYHNLSTKYLLSTNNNSEHFIPYILFVISSNNEVALIASTYTTQDIVTTTCIFPSYH